MRSGGSKAKGAGFERKVCELLSLWITKGQRKDCFWRSSLSGGRATIWVNKKGDAEVRQCGDICSTSPEGHTLTDKYFFELKHVRDPKLETFILGNKGPIAGWWKQAVKQAKDHKREPILIVKGNHAPILIFTKRLCLLNKHPVAHLESCALGLFSRTLKLEPPHAQ